MNLQAEQLNHIIKKNNPSLFNLLSKKGEKTYFPYTGILGQSTAAKGKKYNATIGIACEDDLSPMRLDVLDDQVQVEPDKVFSYASSFGNPGLRRQWKEMILEKNPALRGKLFSLPVVTQALTHGVFLAGFLFLNSGEEVVIPHPYWGNYKLLFEGGLGAKITPFPCFKENICFNLEGLKMILDARVGRKVVLLLNFPNNPTGYTPLSKEIDGIIKLLKSAAVQGTKIVLIIDDAYFGLVYEAGVARESIFGHLADLHENILAVKIDGATKEDYAWGFRVGFITFGNKGLDESGYKALADKAGGAIRGMISNCSQLSQSLLLTAYTSSQYADQKRKKYEIMKNRYQVLKREFQRRTEFSEVFEPLPYNSGYFMCIRLLGDLDAEDVRLHLLENYETGVIALQGFIRIAFSALPATEISNVLD
ncbi:MAG: aminotransferase class I/II-fold pyridoxal phosphate-dependent enzyme, partial [Nitrospiria bacterium]